MVTAIYQVEGPVGWTNIGISGDTEWEVGFWPEFWYIPGKTYNLNVTITPPFGALNTTHWFTVRLHLEENISATHSTDIGVTVRQYADFEWGFDIPPPPGGEFRAFPSSDVILRFAFYNTGNGFDRFIIKGRSEGNNTSWSFDFEKGVDEESITPLLPPDPFKKNPHIVVVIVKIPVDERAGVAVHVSFSATSQFDPAVNGPPAVATIVSLQHYAFNVNVVGTAEKAGTPGDEVEFELVIKNLGNGFDQFTIKPIWNQEINPGFIASANPRDLAIDMMTTETIQYIIKVPSSAPKKTYNFHAEIRSSSPELAPVTKSFTVNVEQFYSIELYSDESNRIQTIPGGNLEFEVTVHNTGNGLDSIVINEVLGAPAGWLTYTLPPEVALLQDQTTSVKIIIIVPSQFEEAPIGLYSLTVPAASTRSDASAEFILEIEIISIDRIEWLVWNNTPFRSFNPYQKDSITNTVEIKNFGNGRNIITLESNSSDPMIALSIPLPIIDLDPDETKQIRIDITVDVDIPPGVHVVYVTATSQGQDSIPRVQPIKFRIENYDALVPPIPTHIDYRIFHRYPMEIERGENKSFKLKVENNGTSPLHGVDVKAFDIYWVDGREVRWNYFNYTTPPIAVGDRFIVGERPFTPSNPPIFWWANRTGNHTLEFRVYYPYQSNTDNDVSSLTFTVLETPREVVDDGFHLPEVRWIIIGILLIVLVSTTAVGLNEWVKEMKDPPRPL